MSGGSFNYLCHNNASDMLESLDDLKRMEQYLREHAKHDAADEVYAYILNVETHKRRLEVATKRVSDLLWAVEWWVSGDTSVEAVDKAMEKLL